MIFLTIDVAHTVMVGVSSADFGQVEELAVRYSADARHHVEGLAPMIQEVLAEAGQKIARDVLRPDAVIVGTGPAAFTGLRAGLVTARALAAAWGVEVYGLSSLEVLALAAADQGANVVVPIIDARRKEVYALRARAMGADDVEVLSDPAVLKPADLAQILVDDPAVVATIEAGLYDQHFVSALLVSPTPVVMTRLLLSRLARQEAGEEIELSTEPQYLRRPDVHSGAQAQAPATGNPYHG